VAGRAGWNLVALAGFASLFLAALWFRVSNLGAIPEHNADESYYGVQAERLVRGEPITARTTTGNLLNPFLLALELPLHAVAQPSLTLLRIPAVLCGVLAVILMFVLGSRALDWTTALIAATLMAVLPVLIYTSRMGLEQSQQPFFGVLTIALAFMGHEVGLFLALLASLLVHPTDVFLLPIAVPVYAVRVYQTLPTGSCKRCRALLRCAIATLIISAAAAAWLLQSPAAQMNLRQRGTLDWQRFLDGIERLIFFLYISVSPASMHLHRWVFRGAALFVLVFGLRALVRRRQTAQLVFLLSLVVSLAAFHVMAGPAVLRRISTYRYGMVFVTPMVIAFACLARSLWPETSVGTPIPIRLRAVPPVALLVIGWALLISMKWNYFDRVAEPAGASFWTGRSERPDPYARTLAVIRDDLARTAGEARAVHPIVAHDYWTTLPLLYLAGSNPELPVSPLIDLESLRVPYHEGRYAANEARLRAQLLAGAYVVEHPGIPVFLGGKVIAQVLDSSFAPSAVRRVGVVEPGGFRIFTLAGRLPTSSMTR
jgi:hypothetical protein